MLTDWIVRDIELDQLLQQRIALLSEEKHRQWLNQGRHGIERETLRVTPQGKLALTSHPYALGSALTHPEITTDYAEALLEFVTPALSNVADVLRELHTIHVYAVQHLDNEYVWESSMPCDLPDDEEIPIAEYGTSHSGMLKHVYRKGLALRYGKHMQCIAGVHYNFSLHPEVWSVLRAHENDASNTLSDKDYQSAAYIALVRNFRRYSWLLMYLFGASPALASSFLQGKPHRLDVLSRDTLYLPHATSLRMSDLGYTSNAQSSLAPYYNSLDGYISSLRHLANLPYQPYVDIGTKRNGEWVQINTNLLQIENEYYSAIRPKQVARRCERPWEALSERGVQYVEVRCMDIDPFDPVGISLQTARFLDVFLHYLAWMPSPLNTEEESKENRHNFERVVSQGRRPGLLLQRHGEQISMKEWGMQLTEEMESVAVLLDEVNGGTEHQDSLLVQRMKLQDVALTPSAQVMQGICNAGGSFARFTLKQSQLAAESFMQTQLDPASIKRFDDMAGQSHLDQASLEQKQTGSFDDFVADYCARI